MSEDSRVNAWSGSAMSVMAAIAFATRRRMRVDVADLMVAPLGGKAWMCGRLEVSITDETAPQGLAATMAQVERHGRPEELVIHAVGGYTLLEEVKPSRPMELRDPWRKHNRKIADHIWKNFIEAELWAYEPLHQIAMIRVGLHIWDPGQWDSRQAWRSSRPRRWELVEIGVTHFDDLLPLPNGSPYKPAGLVNGVQALRSKPYGVPRLLVDECDEFTLRERQAPYRDIRHRLWDMGYGDRAGWMAQRARRERERFHLVEDDEDGDRS